MLFEPLSASFKKAGGRSTAHVDAEYSHMSSCVFPDAGEVCSICKVRMLPLGMPLEGNNVPSMEQMCVPFKIQEQSASCLALNPYLDGSAFAAASALLAAASAAAAITPVEAASATAAAYAALADAVSAAD